MAAILNFYLICHNSEENLRSVTNQAHRHHRRKIRIRTERILNLATKHYDNNSRVYLWKKPHTTSMPINRIRRRLGRWSSRIK